DLSDIRTIQFVEHGLAKSYTLPSSYTVGFGNGFKFGSHHKDSSNLNLPHIFGPCGQISGCALGTLPSGDTIIEQQLYNILKNTYPIVHLSDNWLDSSQNACQYMGNGLFIVHPRTIDMTKLDDPKERD